MKLEKLDQDYLDFDKLQLHDSCLYAIGFIKKENELLLDLDLIEKWIEGTNSFYFQLYPATFVFHNVWDIEMNIEMNIHLIIDNIIRENQGIPRNIDYLPEGSKEYDWIIECLQGSISFKSIGLTIIQRQAPVRKKVQNLSLEERGYLSLSKEGKKYIVR